MGSLIKWVLGILATLVVLFIVAILCIPLFIDPNDYKDRISQTVREQTGRELSIPGDIKLSVSPALKAVLTLGDVSLSSSSEFQGTEFLSSRLVDINLALWPLIREKKLIINKIVLKGLNANLIRNKDGVTNWQDLAGNKGGKKAAKPGKEAPPKAEKPARALPAIDIGGIEIGDFNVSFDDRQAGRLVKLSNFNLQVGRLQTGKPFPVKADFSLAMDDGKQKISLSTGLGADITLNLDQMLFLIDGLNLTTDLAGAPVPISRLALQSSIRADLLNSRVDISDLQVGLDDMQIDGSVSIADLAKPTYTAKLHIKQVDLNKFKSGKKPAATDKDEQNKEKTSSVAAGSSQPKGAAADPQLIPAPLLKKLNFDAEIRIDRLLASKLTMENLQLKATGTNGLVRLQPFSADLYQGTVTVNGTIDASRDIPEISITKELKGVKLGSLFMDLKGKEEVKGTANIRAEVTTRGLTKKELTRHSNGRMQLSLSNGEIAKLKIIDTIRLAKQLYEVGTKKSSAITSAGNIAGRPTSFAELSASGVINNGVFRNEDLLAQSELMKFTGKGTVNLNTEEIDYLLTIYLAKRLERNQENDLVDMADTPIPYKISGTFDKIDQSAALGEIVKAGAVKLLSKELDKQLGKKLGGGSSGEKGTSDISEGAEKLINKGLKSLFGN